MMRSPFRTSPAPIQVDEVVLSKYQPPKPKPFRKKKSKPMAIRLLDLGDRFEFATKGGNEFRNLYVVSSSYSSVCIRGEIKEENKWKRLPPNYCISTEVLVKLI